MKILTSFLCATLAALLLAVAISAQGQKGSIKWKTVKFCSMTFSIPNTIKDEKARGVDSCIAVLSDDAISLSIDYGWYSGVSRYDDYLEFIEKEIVIDGKKGTLATYRDSKMDPEKSWVARLFLVIEPSPQGSNDVATNMFVVVRNRGELVTAEKIIRSIKFEK